MRLVVLLTAFAAGAGCGRSPTANVVTTDAAGVPATLGSRADTASANGAVQSYVDADVVVVARLRADPPVALETDPPQYVHSFDVTVEEQLSGCELPPHVAATYTSRTQSERLPADVPMLVALRRVRRNLRQPIDSYEALRVEPATPALRAELSGLRKAPAGLSLSVTQVPAGAGSPAPEGDGVFELTLRNDGAQSIHLDEVLVADGAHWADALEIREEGQRTLHAPSTVAGSRRPLDVPAHSELKATIDVKRYGVTRRVGGGFLSYSFGLGPARISSGFYYIDAYHGTMLGKP